MIDWIKAIIPFRHSKLINDGSVVSISRDGEIEWTTKKRRPVSGSYDSKVHVRTASSFFDEIRTFDSLQHADGIFTHLEIDGNLTKFFQGHNLWGSNDLVGLVCEFYFQLVNLLDISEDDRNIDDLIQIIDGNFELLRVDCTDMLSLSSEADVEAFIYSAERSAILRYKGQAFRKGLTLYFGKNSRRESFKIYSKAKELQVKGRELPADLPQRGQLLEWVKGKLRVEVVERSLQLKERSLRLAKNWTTDTSPSLVNEMLGKIQMSENYVLPDAELKAKNLKPRLLGVYELWKKGENLKEMMSLASFKRYRKELKEALDIDIAIVQQAQEKPTNIIDFRRVLTPERVVSIPDFALGTSLYFEPRKFG